MAMLMAQLQYHSPGGQIYYWFGNAFGVIRNSKGEIHLRYVGTEEKVREALANGTKSVRPWVNELLERERQNCAVDTLQREEDRQ